MTMCGPCRAHTKARRSELPQQEAASIGFLFTLSFRPGCADMTEQRDTPLVAPEGGRVQPAAVVPTSLSAPNGDGLWLNNATTRGSPSGQSGRARPGSRRPLRPAGVTERPHWRATSANCFRPSRGSVHVEADALSRRAVAFVRRIVDDGGDRRTLWDRAFEHQEWRQPATTVPRHQSDGKGAGAQARGCRDYRMRGDLLLSRRRISEERAERANRRSAAWRLPQMAVLRAELSRTGNDRPFAQARRRLAHDARLGRLRHRARCGLEGDHARTLSARGQIHRRRRRCRFRAALGHDVRSHSKAAGDHDLRLASGTAAGTQARDRKGYAARRSVERNPGEVETVSSPDGALSRDALKPKTPDDRLRPGARDRMPPIGHREIAPRFRCRRGGWRRSAEASSRRS